MTFVLSVLELQHCNNCNKFGLHKLKYKKVSQNGTQFKYYLYLCKKLQEIKTDIEYGSSNRQRLQGQHR